MDKPIALSHFRCREPRLNNCIFGVRRLAVKLSHNVRRLNVWLLVAAVRTFHFQEVLPSHVLTLLCVHMAVTNDRSKDYPCNQITWSQSYFKSLLYARSFNVQLHCILFLHDSFYTCRILKCKTYSLLSLQCSPTFSASCIFRSSIFRAPSKPCFRL